jgi:hypothetical protein
MVGFIQTPPFVLGFIEATSNKIISMVIGKSTFVLAPTEHHLSAGGPLSQWRLAPF